MEFAFATAENLEGLTSPSTSVKRVVQAITGNWESWKILISSLSSLSSASSGDDRLLVAVIKVLGRVCSDQCTLLEEDEISGVGDDDEDEVPEQLLANVLRTVCNAEFFNVVSRKVVSWTKIHQLKSGRSKTPQEDYNLQSGEILTCLRDLCGHLMKLMPFTAKDACANLVLTTLGILNLTESYLDQELPQLFKDFQNIQESIVAVNKEFEKEDKKNKCRYGFSAEQELLMHEREPPNDFRTIAIVPTVKELLTDKRPFLRPNKAEGSYTDAEHYLDVQFRLLREDFVQPLRKGVEDFLEFREEYIRTNGRKRRRDVNQNSSVRLYTGVTFREMQISPNDNSSSYLFNLPENLVKKVNWVKSKRLLPGSLVFLTSDFCGTASFATVMVPSIDRRKDKEQSAAAADPRRQELIRGILRVSVEAGSEFIQMNKSYVMLECEAFFEAYRYNLSILQKMNLAEFPLAKFLVSPNTSVATAPSYFEERAGPNNADANNVIDLKIKLPFLTGVHRDPDKQINIEAGAKKDYLSSLLSISNSTSQQCRVSVRDPESWPSLEIQQKLGLDENQYKAYRAALTSEIAIIQGPPGTGKTFIGLKIVQTILMNKCSKLQQWRSRSGGDEGYFPSSPILVVCYTNHALDQFLELLNTHGESNLKMVRVGGQCKTPSLASCMLPEIRKQLQARSSSFTAVAHQQRVRHAMHELRNTERRLESLQNEVDALFSFSGLINFSNLDWRVREGLKKYVPAGMLEMLMCKRRCLSFLGLTEEDFRDRFFSVTICLKGFFRLRVKRQAELASNSMSFQSQTECLNGQFQLVDSLQPSEDMHFETELVHLEDEEYDLDELVEQRVLEMHTEDYVNFDEGENDPVSKFQLPFFTDWSVDSLRAKLFATSSLIEKFQQDFNGHCKKDHKGNRKMKKANKDCRDCKFWKERLNLQTQEKVPIENKLKFILALFNSYKAGLLDLPNNLLTKMLENHSAAENNEASNNGNQDNFESDDNDSWILNNLMKKSVGERWTIYFHVVKLAQELAVKLIPTVKGYIDQAKHELNMARQMVDGQILKQADIVGMTTTGASKYHDLLEIAKPEIVIIEEAAEILEAHTVTSLTSHCKHLILIGDHLQLRPSTNVYHLARKFHLDLSLFERMINNDMNLWSLKTQHRMRPDIADLIIGPIYKELHNHETVLHYPNVKGVERNLFLISHNELEETDNEMLSKSNTHEADFITTLCYYLIQQGYDSDKITILTTYMGQMFLLKKKLNRNCGRVRITCIDNYQGEENDIILLSLVRSNTENKIGFVGIDNRICVALSRAKHGLFIMGNVKSLTARSETWTQVYEKLNAKGNCGESLPLKCQRHQTVTHVARAKDFVPLQLGGCKNPCDFKLSCGHLCTMKCHGFDQEHKEYRCKKECEKLCGKELHPCTAECFRECPPCKAKVVNELKCGHHQEMYCSEDPTKICCRQIVPRILPKCGHEEQLPCHINYSLYPCHRRVKKVLKCDHIKEMECHMDENLVVCKELVEKQLPCGHNQFIRCCVNPADANCLTEVSFVLAHCHHEQKLQCYKTKTAKCIEKCGATLNCEHKCRLTCHVTDDPNHEKYNCRKRCKRKCGAPEHHPCQTVHPCYETCPPCSVTMTKTLPCDPEHIADLACHEDGESYECQVDTRRTLRPHDKPTA